jgi:chemotaxis protein MotA
MTKISSWQRLRKEEQDLNRQPLSKAILLITLITVFAVAAVYAQSFRAYIDFPSLLIVIGGLVIVALVSFSASELVFTARRVITVSGSKLESAKARIHLFGRLAHLVRANGVVVLERESRRISDSFVRRALELVADANSEKDLIRILETEKLAFANREQRAIEVLETLGNFAPGIGLIGTLLGLVQMMASLDNPSVIGPAMSIALLTTLYGAVLANMVFLPFAAKLRLRSDQETLLRGLSIEAAVSLLKAENPTLLEQRLETFLPAFIESRKAA